ncbi:unnamed protein product (macronuclear) [Paramecium tetraurelia]|uniref:Uncharacterized protein n=1 Tax=Paramecium tetraurelia TaxID=5888 RepID=A0DGY8_PARTE|nr:uncharacterized protein GSPATT00002434001 [Paramecium tetraurelia]CAK82305.1 unnamed protein product [Paramecium tetraurelia]|eukprot:XP_001449702.1 hypothetical protein (macronuclear) [Paramecium tetraurelia strain d4-2]
MLGLAQKKSQLLFKEQKPVIKKITQHLKLKTLTLSNWKSKELTSRLLSPIKYQPPSVMEPKGQFLLTLTYNNKNI